MNYSKIGVRYAKALLKVAIEKKLLEEVKQDMLFLDSMVVSVPEFLQVINSPVIKPSEKQTIFKAALTNNLSTLSLQFIYLLIAHRRENRIRDIIRNFIDQYREYKGILSATLITPVAIDETTRKEMAEILQKKYEKTIELSPKVDPSILGGFILQVSDLQYDSSVRTRLKKVRQELINTPLENK
jgi:F-type H+-transporting ATPase subunit delta